MSIFSLHPKNFEYLKNSLSKNEGHGAYLFYGQRGAGKLRFALEFARYIQCKEKGSDGPCEKCQNCLLSKDGHIISGTVIDKKEGGNISIDEVREVKRGLELSSYGGNKKIVIINDFHNINYQAKDLLLKTLEEPPRDTIFMLITPNKASVSNTILSRCFEVFFSKKVFKDWEGYFSDVGGGIEDKERVYLDLLGDINAEDHIGKDLEGDIFQEIESLFGQKNYFEKMNLAKKTTDSGDFQEKVRAWTFIFYHIFLLHHGEVVFSENTNTKLKNLEKQLGYDRIVDILEKLSKIFYFFDKNNSKRVLLENLVLNN